MKKKQVSLGGQAVLEGVMVKSPDSLAVAVRAPNGKIKTKKIKQISLSEKITFFKLPFFRGMLSIFEVLIYGMKAMNYSAQMGDDEEEETTIWELVLALFISISLALLIFKFIPLLLATSAAGIWSLLQKGWVFNLLEGILKAGIFVLYIFVISRFKEIKRLFQYHGAEHMSISCYEEGKKLTINNVKKYSPVHRRCGTTFLFLVILLSIIVYTFIPYSFSFWQKLLWRIILLPVIAGFSYELLKLGYKYQDNIFTNIAVAPGLWLQKMTTAQPDNKQIEVAIASVKAAVSRKK